LTSTRASPISALAKAYAAGSVLVVDDALSAEAFEQLRNLLLDSTVFFETKMPLKFGAYVGAIVEDGLHARAFLALADALKKQCPELLGEGPATVWKTQATETQDIAAEAAIQRRVLRLPETQKGRVCATRHFLGSGRGPNPTSTLLRRVWSSSRVRHKLKSLKDGALQCLFSGKAAARSLARPL
jgi:hypothetical protein